MGNKYDDFYNINYNKNMKDLNYNYNNKYSNDDLISDDVNYNMKNNSGIFSAPDHAFFLSYGENGGFVPVGVFVIGGLVDKGQKPLTGPFPNNLDSLYIELCQCEFLDNKAYRKKLTGEKIYIPILKLKNLIVNHSAKNTAVLDQLAFDVYQTPFGERPMGPSMLSLFNDAVSEYLISHFLGNETIKLSGESLESLDGILKYESGEERKTNYTVMPVSLGRFKDKSRIREFNEIEKNNFKDFDKIPNIIPNTYNNYNPDDFKDEYPDDLLPDLGEVRGFDEPQINIMSGRGR